MAVLTIDKKNDKNWELKCQVAARYNMNLDNGTFIQGHIYQCYKKSKDIFMNLITTEEGTKQELSDLDLIALFDNLKN